MKTVKLMALWIVFAGIAAMPIFAETAGIEAKMNKEIKIDLKDVMITEALDKIGKEVDVPIKLSDEAEWKLPYGKSTRLSVTLKGPASESLTQMLNEFFMRYAVGQDEITIFPRPELDHIIGRPSARQLNVLKAIYTMPIRVYITDNVSMTINSALDQEVFISPINLHQSINATLRQLAGERKFKKGGFTESKKPVYVVQLPPGGDGNESKEYTLPTAVIFPQLLGDIRLGRGDTVEWYIPSIDLPNQVPEIRIVEAGTLYSLKRKQLIDVNYENKTLLEIFQNLVDRAGASDYQKHSQVLPYLDERMTVSMQNVTAMQAMKKIADMAQLRYETDSYRKFYIIDKVKPAQPAETPATPAKPKAGSSDRGPYVGKISIPMEGGKYYIEYMLRESDLTEELKKLRTEKITEIIGSQPQEESPPKPDVPEK
jgi:hypothetical protein